MGVPAQIYHHHYTLRIDEPENSTLEDRQLFVPGASTAIDYKLRGWQNGNFMSQN